MEFPNHYSQNLFFREAYLSYSDESSELKMGQQIISWGKSDGINPTDYLSAKNYKFLNPDEEVKRQGSVSLNYSYTPNQGASPFNYQFVFQANHPETKLLIPEQKLPTGINFKADSEAAPIFSNDAMEFAFKVSYLKSSYDFSLSYFHGFAHLPEYFFNPVTLSIVPFHPKENAFGGDASFTWNDFIWRAESALILLENGSESDPLRGLVEPNHWDSVVGVERPFLSDFRVQLQMLYRYHFAWQAPQDFQAQNQALTQIYRAVGSANALLLNYLEASNLGATLRIAFSNETSNWSADLFLLGYFSTNQDYLLRPEIAYKIMDNAKLTLGADLYGGSANRPLGALKSKSVAFFEAKILF